jgi:hypothetical protein
MLSGALLHTHLADAVIDARGFDDAGPSAGFNVSGFST